MTITFSETKSLVSQCRELLGQLPSVCAFSHLTAARLHGLPLSYAMEEDLRTHVLRPISCSRVKRPRVVGHRALHRREIVVVDGLPVVGLADTWADLGELIGRGKPVGLDDAIVLGDAVATQLGTADPLLATLLQRIRPRGKNTLLEAWDLVRVGSASPRETLSRLMFVRSGLPDPVPNVPIYADDDPDRLLGVGDHVWHLRRPGSLPDIKVIGEYQGEEFHSSPDQRKRDGVRRRGLEAAGWLVLEIWKSDMATTEARRSTVLRFAAELGVPVETLDLSGCEPRFFSQYALDRAIQRDDRRRGRGSRH